MLTIRQVIPPVTARAADGRVVQAWDYKQKKNLVLVFLHPGCRRCEDFLSRLAEQVEKLRELEAVALVIYPEAAPASANFPPGIILAGDVSGHSQHEYLGEEAFSPAGQERVGAFVADRYGELRAQWIGAHEDSLPQVGAILGWLGQIQVACEECGPPHWPLE